MLRRCTLDRNTRHGADSRSIRPLQRIILQQVINGLRHGQVITPGLPGTCMHSPRRAPGTTSCRILCAMLPAVLLDGLANGGQHLLHFLQFTRVIRCVAHGFGSSCMWRFANQLSSTQCKASPHTHESLPAAHWGKHRRLSTGHAMRESARHLALQRAGSRFSHGCPTACSSPAHSAQPHHDGQQQGQGARPSGRPWPPAAHRRWKPSPHAPSPAPPWHC